MRRAAIECLTKPIDLFAGTNDKAGGPHYILKWTTPQSIKETFVPQTDLQYPYMK